MEGTWGFRGLAAFTDHGVFKDDDGAVFDIRPDSPTSGVHPCPQGYCCDAPAQSNSAFNQTEDEDDMLTVASQGGCLQYLNGYYLNSCSGNRRGVLCGSCAENYTYSVLSAKCLPIDECNSGEWFIPLALVIMTGYVAYLVTTRSPGSSGAFRTVTYFFSTVTLVSITTSVSQLQVRGRVAFF